MKMPETVTEAWGRREGPVILATASNEGTPNIIYVTCVRLQGDGRLVVADNYFDKTRRNIKDGSRGAALFMTNDNKAYQLKGVLEYHDAGPVYEDMKKWNPPTHPGHGAAVLVVEEAYSGSNRLAP